MSKTLLIILFCVYSVLCQAQTQSVNAFHHKSFVREKNPRFEVDSNRDGYKNYIFNSLELELQFNPKHLLSNYTFYFNTYIDEQLFFVYDSSDRISSVAKIYPIEDTVYFLRSNNTGFIDAIQSTIGDTMFFVYNSDGSIKSITHGVCSIKLKYDEKGNIIDEIGPRGFSNVINSSLTEIDNYLRMASEFKDIVDSCPIYMIERYQMAEDSTSFAVYFQCQNVTKCIVTRSEISMNLDDYFNKANIKKKKPKY